MKDNRSLEQKIKAVVRESHEKRNSEIRMKMSNVGRPTDNVKDNSSKLAKQGEIKTKIIDEDSEYDMARNELDTAKRAIDRLKTKMGKGEGELEAWVQSKITKASDYLDTVADYIESGSVKEEAIDEAGRVLPDLTQKEPEKKHSKEYLSRMPKKRDNGLWKAYVKTGAEWAKPEGVKEEAIDEDAVASVSTKDTAKEQPEGKKKPNNKDLQEPGTIKGGKTEVDTEPTTDDRDDDGKKIDDKAKKATKAANAQAGVKEETMNTTKHFGLPADLIATVVEALKGNQKNIDKNHNGKIDKQDFKILQGKKAEKIKAYRADRDKHGEMEEEAIDEVLDTPMKKLGYIAKNAYQVATADPAKMANDPKKANAIANRVIGAKRFQKKLNKEEVESIEELSKEAMKRYTKQVDKKGEGDKRSDGLGMASKKIAKQETDRTLQRAVNKIGNTPMNQTKASDAHKYDASRQELKGRGTHNFAGRRTKYEEVEQIDEVSHRDYAAKGMMHPDMAKGMHVGMEADFYAHGTGDKKYGKVVKNSGGQVHIKQTHDSYSDKKVNKLHKFKVSSSIEEETDPGFSEAELAHINAILESDDFNYANSKDHKPLSNWPKVHAAIHNDYSDSGGGGTEGEKTELGKTPIHPKYHAAHDEAEANPKKMKKAINVHYGHDVSRDD